MAYANSNLLVVLQRILTWSWHYYYYFLLRIWFKNVKNHDLTFYFMEMK